MVIQAGDGASGKHGVRVGTGEQEDAGEFLEVCPRMLVVCMIWDATNQTRTREPGATTQECLGKSSALSKTILKGSALPVDPSPPWVVYRGISCSLLVCPKSVLASHRSFLVSQRRFLMFEKLFGIP